MGKKLQVNFKIWQENSVFWNLLEGMTLTVFSMREGRNPGRYLFQIDGKDTSAAYFHKYVAFFLLLMTYIIGYIG